MSILASRQAHRRCSRRTPLRFAALPAEPWVVRDITLVETLLGMTALVQGDFVAAEARSLVVLEEQRRLERMHRAPYPYVSFTQTTLGHVARARGDHAAALLRYQGALQAALPSWQVYSVAWGLGGVAGTLAAVGRWAEAARLFGATEALCERAGIRFQTHVFDWQRAFGLPEPWGQASASLSFGAATILRTAVQLGAASPLPLPDPRAAANQWAAGRREPIAQVIALALAADLEAFSPLPGEHRAQPSVRSDPFGLSPREGEVLALLCQRLSDAEIGDALFISPRTASRHVANLFNKLGVSSRREAAARAVHHRLI
jgi:DNA-binding CsgD family transcriptional regulator